MPTVHKSRIFIDTNILIYANAKSQPLGLQAKSRMKELINEGHGLVISTQVIREYAHATLRNAIFHRMNLKSSIEDVIFNINEFYENFEIVHETQAIIPIWLKLLPTLTTNKDVFDFISPPPYKLTASSIS